ncbi:helix-turn-helix transcriptional regulator [bacterium]|nr:helix-turn-helix transcriptional regulator [bacterium]
MKEMKARVLFGKRIKQLRNNLNITQFTLGEQAEINQRQVTLIETGKSFPSFKTLIKFTEIFSCNLQDLFMFDNLQEREILEQELKQILETSTDEKLKTLYTIAKELI